MTPADTTPPAMRAIVDEHRTLAAVLRSVTLMLRRGPGDAPAVFFDSLRAMLFYIDEYPERLHHPKESDLLFPKLLRVAPHLLPVIASLEQQHVNGQARVRELQHLLLAWELLGDSRRAAFEKEYEAYSAYYIAHMRTEESEVLPVALELLGDDDWEQLGKAFAADADPLSVGMGDPRFERLFSRIVMRTPAPIGLGSEA